MNDADIRSLVEKAKKNGGESPRMSEALGAYAYVALKHMQAGTVMIVEEGICAAVEAAMAVAPAMEVGAPDVSVPAVQPTTVAALTLDQRMRAAVWMVGNIDTPEDKMAWWHTFDPTWKEVAADGKNAQAYADLMFLSEAEIPPVKSERLAPPHEHDSERWHWI